MFWFVVHSLHFAPLVFVWGFLVDIRLPAPLHSSTFGDYPRYVNFVFCLSLYGGLLDVSIWKSHSAIAGWSIGYCWCFTY